MHTYVRKHIKNDFDPILFKYFVHQSTNRRLKNRLSKWKVFGASEDMVEGSSLCTFPDGTYSNIVTSELMSVKAAYASGLLIDKDSYIPTNFEDCCSSSNPVWIEATEVQMKVLKKHGVGLWVPKKDYPDAHILTSRFVYQIKRRGLDNYEPYCRWTPRGFQEREGIDYDETFANIPSLASLRMLLIKILLKKNQSFHLDFKGAFSNTPLDREILVSTPKGYKRYDGEGNELILSLKKSVYGLKQSGHDWEKMLEKFLLEYGFTHSLTEPMLFTKKLPDGSDMDILIWVDDVFGSCNSEAEITTFVEDLNLKFGVECNNLGPISLALGMDVCIEENSITISQESAIDKLLKDSDMEDCQCRDLPLPPSFKLDTALDSELLDDVEKQRYQSIIGSLLWINRGTRPDISFAVWLLTRNMHNPTKELLTSALYLVRFLKRTKKAKLNYTNRQGISGLDLSEYSYDSRSPFGFADANWESPRSVSSNIVMCCNAAIIWAVRKQTNVALSTVQAELTALSDEACEMLYCQKVFKDLNMDFKEPSTVYCDSKGAIENAKHPVRKNRLKHVDTKCFFIRECVDNQKLIVTKIGTHDNIADIGTKLLGKLKYFLFATFIMNYKFTTTMGN